MRLRFGTDGVRGRAPEELSPAFVRALGRVAAAALGPGPFLVGRDTRASGPALEAALVAGLADGGVEAVVLGVASTPAVAWLAAADERPAAVISASHNPFGDNGVKLFAAGGRKLADAAQAEIETRLDAELDRAAPQAPARHDGAGPEVAREVAVATDAPALLARYEAAVVASLRGRRLDGLRVVVDAANGAAFALGPHILRSLGAEVVALATEPDGRNINAGCGSTHPEKLQAAVVELGADAGLAFDGDADRVLAVDADGNLVDGDQIIAVCALDRLRRGELVPAQVVVTVMANLGFRLAMAEHGIGLVETAVGDRYVLEALETTGALLGGEQSGHIIFRDLASTGDGVLTGVQLLDVVARTGRPLGELAAAAMTRFPQVLHNVRLGAGVRAAGVVEAVAPAIAAAEAELGERGRVLVRPSGTEPLVRVMVEAPDAATADTIAASLAKEIERLARKP